MEIQRVSPWCRQNRRNWTCPSQRRHQEYTVAHLKVKNKYESNRNKNHMHLHTFQQSIHHKNGMVATAINKVTLHQKRFSKEGWVQTLQFMFNSDFLLARHHFVVVAVARGCISYHSSAKMEPLWENCFSPHLSCNPLLSNCQLGVTHMSPKLAQLSLVLHTHLFIWSAKSTNGSGRVTHYAKKTTKRPKCDTEHWLKINQHERKWARLKTFTVVAMRTLCSGGKLLELTFQKWNWNLSRDSTREGRNLFM